MDPPLIGPLLTQLPLKQEVQQVAPEFGHGMQPVGGAQSSWTTCWTSSPSEELWVNIQQSTLEQQMPPQLQNPPSQQKPSPVEFVL